MSRKFEYVRFMICCLLSIALAFSQSFTASVRGSVTDGTGALVPGAAIIVTEVGRNVQHKTVTDSSGRYFITALPPGQYTLAVEATGFRKYVQSEFPLTVQQQATIDIALQVGEVASTVQVEGSAPLLNTTISSLGQVVDNKYILSLPNIGRDSLNLAYMTPGVVGSAGRR